ncbi:MAG TPA: DUF1244 domain-containing protein, partial [Sorangium sp.]|nr:DUF1244 domain-containing protein [Sorangium sp.]
AFRKLVKHFRNNTNIQNIDVMNAAGLCRNCLAKWYRAEAELRGETLSYEQAREIIYGMPYAEWKAKYQQPSESAESQPATSSEPPVPSTSEPPVPSTPCLHH